MAICALLRTPAFFEPVHDISRRSGTAILYKRVSSMFSREFSYDYGDYRDVKRKLSWKFSQVWKRCRSQRKIRLTFSCFWKKSPYSEKSTFFSRKSISKFTYIFIFSLESLYNEKAREKESSLTSKSRAIPCTYSSPLYSPPKTYRSIPNTTLPNEQDFAEFERSIQSS